MKRSFAYVVLSLSLIGTLLVSSCDVLEKVPGSDVTEDTVFATRGDFEKYLYGTYSWGMVAYFPYHNLASSLNPNPTMCVTAPMCDEAEMATSWHASHVWNSGSVNSSSIVSQEDRRWNLRWQVLRRCNILLDRIPDTDYTEAEKKGFMGEVYFIRALNNFELFKRYGGMPMIPERLQLTDDWDIPRASVEDYVEYMVGDCDKAAENLKGINYSANETGRVTRTAALALKAKVLMYAASPLFNSATPYMDYEHPELICYGNYDKERWKRAADAYKQAIDECTAQGLKILNRGEPEEDYRRVFEEYDNEEIILAEKSQGSQAHWAMPWALLIPAGLNMSAWADNGICVTHNHIAKYEKMDGTPMQWNAPGVRGDDIMEKYAQLDPRFRQTVAYNGSPWNVDFPDMKLYSGASGNSPSPSSNKTGALMHKIIPRSLVGNKNNYVTPNSIMFRMAELYLSYAECLNEYLDSPSAEVYNAVHPVRARAGMPDFPAGLDKNEMRRRIHNERDVELCFEEHRMWDIRRWKIAEQEGVMSGKIYKEVLYHVSGTGLNQKCDYEIQLLENRTFKTQMYLHPILKSECNKGVIFQNPGWV